MSSPFADSIREQLVAVAYRQRRQRRLRIGGLLTSVATAVTGGLVVLLPSPASADVEVTISDGFVEVRMTDLHTDPRQVLDALHEHDLEAEVITRPTGPSNVGRFLAVERDDGAGFVEMLGDNGGGHDGFRIREDWTGVLTIILGRQADDGESYDAPTNAFAASEGLHCAGVFGQPLAAAAERLDDYDVDAQLSDDGLWGEVMTLDVALTSYPDRIVTEAIGLSSDRLLLRIEAEPPITEPGC